ncbi:flagellar hook-basal body protein [Lysinibacillus telephonicus]|uniref:Flagellar hook-basal body protein n=1 Tax=Lysinibacillus telephonicus TaxID=1714840 RepID=A0A3S0HES4_9BACI|nr:flagellar hook-basal body protein [Lysinibacillus telephonicus]RTQ89827.1 flagellar hook-basal body protein [Lysinibacillus telephonicus]
MLRTMITATNTLNQLQSQIDTISNNISNSNTVGYKTKEARFSELLYQQFNNDEMDTTIRQSPVGIRYGVGAKIGQIQTNHAQGNLQNTDRDLDLAFTKEKQYFNILMPDENGQRVVYSRQGDFYVSPVANGQVMLVNGDGYAVADSNGQAIYFPDNVKNFNLTNDGMLLVNYEDGETLSFELGVTELQKPQVMEHVSGTYIALPANLNELGYNQGDVLTNLQGAARNEIGIAKGKLEMSNVDLSKEMTDLINAQRSYQFNSRAISIADQMLGLINGIR